MALLRGWFGSISSETAVTQGSRHGDKRTDGSLPPASKITRSVPRNNLKKETHATGDAVYEDLSFDEICDRVDDLQARIHRAEELCEQANKKFAEYKTEIRRLQEMNADFRKQATSQCKENAKHEANAKSKASAEPKANTKPKASAEPKASAKPKASAEPKANAQGLPTREELSLVRHCLEEESLKRIAWNPKAPGLEEKVIRGRRAVRTFEESRDMILPSEKSLEELAMLPCQPFIVMLVDGDSYRFSRTLMNSGPDAGVAIAQALWLEMSKYILEHSHIPSSSKIVVRVFYNGRATLGPRVGNNMRQYTKMEETMVKMAETQPLFDFIDCGGGKERADDKIKENTHLYIGNSDCHAIFLAVCNDNGFARMLERYQKNTVAQAKIVLVQCGPLAREIAALDFTNTSFPRVFNTMQYSDTYTKKANRKPQVFQDGPPMNRKERPAPLSYQVPQIIGSQEPLPSFRAAGLKHLPSKLEYAFSPATNGMLLPSTRKTPRSNQGPCISKLTAAEGRVSGLGHVFFDEEAPSLTVSDLNLDIFGLMELFQARVPDGQFLVPFPFRYYRRQEGVSGKHEKVLELSDVDSVTDIIEKH